MRCLRSARKQAGMANEAKSAFLATMSREIRTPLDGVIGRSEVVLGPDLTREQRAHLETIVSRDRFLPVVIVACRPIRPEDDGNSNHRRIRMGSKTDDIEAAISEHDGATDPGANDMNTQATEARMSNSPADRPEGHGRARRSRAGFLAAATAALALLAAVPATASASTSTSLLGNTSIPRIPREGTPANSDCPAGSTALGARIWYDTFSRITGVASWCRNSDGSAVLSNSVGDSVGPFGDSVCSGADLAIGLYGANGEVLNALGVRCAGAGGAYDASRVGNPATVASAADCPVGSALVGLTAWYGPYGSLVNVYGIQGACDVQYTVSGVLQPINSDGSSVFKTGRIVPVKFTVADSTGASVANLTASLSVTKLTDTVEGTYVEADTNVAASTGFRYDSATGQYIYNWSTKGLDPGTYRIRVTIDYGPTITGDLSLR